MITFKPLTRKLSAHNGKLAEHYTCEFLMTQGLRLIKKNYTCRLGEIDLIMQNKNILIFVEVRLRSSSAYGSALESVSWSKQRKIFNSAEYFLKAHQQFADFTYRFDVIAFNKILVKPSHGPLYTFGTQTYQLQWLINAFEGSP